METWLKHGDANKTLLYQVPNYTPIHIIRKGSRKGGGVTLFVHSSLNYKERHNVSKSSDIIKTLSVEIINKNKSYIVSDMYRAPDNDGKLFKNENENYKKNNLVSEKQLFAISDVNTHLNLNLTAL